MSSTEGDTSEDYLNIVSDWGRMKTGERNQKRVLSIIRFL